MSSPYSDLPDRAYWKTGVEQRHPLNPGDIYQKKFSIGANDKIATAGSCFAQHIARHMRTSGFTVIDQEPAPKGISADLAHRYQYGTYSARFGNIYTSRQLLQLAQSSFGRFTPENFVWTKADRFYDGLRPLVEPQGLRSKDEVLEHRKSHLKNVRKMFERANIIIFTLGLTETWEDVRSGTVYPAAPGAIIGQYDPKLTRFKNLTHSETLTDFLEFRYLLKEHNPTVKFILTVSPVPLTATASGGHVLPATIYSKSVLRAVAGELHNDHDDIDYFPSYEIIAAHPSRGIFYEGNLRSVSPEGVEIVMNSFFSQHRKIEAATEAKKKTKTAQEVVCEEALLEAFAS